MSARDAIREEEKETGPYRGAYEVRVHPMVTRAVRHGGGALAATPGLVSRRKMLGTADCDETR